MANILLIEDEAVTQRRVMRILRQAGHTVDVTRDGQEALDYLAAQPAPDLILLDIIMPRADGFEFRERQRQDARIADVPVILFTSLSSSGRNPREPDAHLLDDMGIDTWISKPFTSDELLQVISQRLAGVTGTVPQSWPAPA